MKTILVPTDFSPEAEAGVEYATGLSKIGGYRLLLLHAFHLNTADVLYTQMVPAANAFRDSARSQLSAARDMISVKAALPPESIFEDGDLATVIRKTLHERKIDLIIMGTRGAKGLKKLLSGSHTSAIIRTADCPVISVPHNTKFKGLMRVSFATDYHRDDIEELCWLVALVEPFKALINVIHVAKMNEGRNASLMNAFERNVRAQIHYPHIAFQVLKGERIIEGLHNYLEAEKPDLFAISTRKRLIIERLAGPGISETLSLESRFPMLVYHQATPPLIF